MSVRVVEYADKQWEVDIRYRLSKGPRSRERRVLTGLSKPAATRWGQERERHLLQHGPNQPKKEVPTLAEFKDDSWMATLGPIGRSPAGLPLKS